MRFDTIKDMPVRKTRTDPESDESSDKEGDGDTIHRSVSLENLMKQRAALMLKTTIGPEPVQSQTQTADNRSIEIFFGKLTNFGTFYQSLADNGYKTPRTASADGQKEVQPPKPDLSKTTVNPSAVKKLCLVGHPLTSFKGLNGFKKLSEAWVTNCSIEELKWTDFEGLNVLQRLYLFGGRITSIEPLYFENLRVLWLSGNKLTSLSFLTHGLASLIDLNVAKNQITCLEAEHLFKCVALQSLNIAGNPLCTIQDVQSVNVLPSLRQLYLVDPVYGKCPVSCLCESRAMLIHKLGNITNLNGKDISPLEHRNIQEFINQRCLYYYASSVSIAPTHVMLRKTTLISVYKQLESLGGRILDLATLSARCLQADYQMTSLAMFASTKAELLAIVAKIHTRLSGLRQWARVVMRRIETMLRVSRWEQQIDEWLRWVEFQSYGIILGYIGQSVLDPDNAKDKENLRATMHQLISGLSCSKQWPTNSVMKIETVVVVKDKGTEAGLEKIFEDNYSRKYEPKFAPPAPEELEPLTTDSQQPVYPFYGPPSVQPMRMVTTYTDPGYKPPQAAFPYPESVPGLPERSQPLLMFLVCQTSNGQCDPLLYFHNLFFEKSRCYKDIRLTNCMWAAAEINYQNYTGKEKGLKPPIISNTILCVVKVLEECLVLITRAKTQVKQHCHDCQIFGVTKPLCFAPAYVLFVSHSPIDKSALWYQGITEDSDVAEGAEVLLDDMASKLMEYGTHAKSNTPYYLHRTHDGVKADLTAITKIVPNGPKTPQGKPSSNIFITSRSGVDLLSVAKFLGPDIAQSITSLDLSGNRLGLTVGLEGLSNLRKLNLSHNNLTTLSGIHKLPHLRELRAGWNYLRFIHSNIATLAWACSKLMVLELLPNPFQDVRDYSHIPVLAQEAIPTLTRVDAWTSPFTIASTYLVPKGLNSDINFTKEIMKKTWVGQNYVNCSDFKAQCLSKLHVLPPQPPFPEGCGTAALELDLSDNYITASNLISSPIIKNMNWRSALVKLHLQENSIQTLDWIEENLFPNLRILNLSNNMISEMAPLSFGCQNLMHLQLCGNPFPCNTFVLAPLRSMKQLLTLDASRTPVSTHPDYSKYVLKHLCSVQILDGVPLIDWNTEDSVYKLGGNLCTDWIQINIGKKNWNTLTELSLPYCGLQNVNFPSGSLPKLLSLDLTGNNLQCLTGLASLPNLRVLCVSHNSIKTLGDTPCPTCFSNTAENFSIKNSTSSMGSGKGNPNSSIASVVRAKTPEKNKFKTSSPSEILSPRRPSSRGSNYSNSSSSVKLAAQNYSPPPIDRKGNKGVSKSIFPQLEVLILSHNGLNGVSDLHLHALPSLRTVILNCNKIKGFEGLDNLPTIKAIVLDNNHISSVPFSCLAGCSSLKYLHLEHNKISALPRLPHLTNLVSLYLGYNRIQSLTDMSCLENMQIEEITLIGNPAIYRNDYSKNVFIDIPYLRRLDGTELVVSLNKGRESANLKFKEKYKIVHDPDEKGEVPVGVIPNGGIRIREKPPSSENEE